MNNPGLSPAVQAALARRNMGAPIPQLSQVSGQVPMASGQTPQPMPQSAMTKSSTIPNQPKAPSQKFQPTNQQDMLVMSLIEQMKNNNKLEAQKLKVAQGQSIQPPTPQVPQFNQTPPQNSGNVFGSPTTMATSSMQGGNPLSSGPF